MEMNIPIGLCDITYDGQTHYNLASEAIFRAEPTYETIRFGALKKGHLLTDYIVSFEFNLSEESYNTLKLSNASLVNYKGGMYDNPLRKLSIEGKPLTIHPVDYGNSKEYDITIFKAIIDPKKAFERVYSKGTEMINIRFLGQPAQQINRSGFNSFYYIGDTVKAGISL
ncbi:hypothetical protein NSA56_01820 [Oceanobacillus caeni]|uniref:hypothetical protein n=1 Tax=Oceanobacillus caeni TaxID=405946 RepID=UPI0021499DD1|nr:hypothetical protein [Oceanobacillus caeni]MCR1833134.1 hypothetical protein [Oceanobacillus caeni]